MDMRKLVGRNFGRIRKEKGFTQERFAEASGFTQQYISGLERGRRNPTIVTLFELASALGISHVDLVVPDDEARSERSKSSKRKKDGARSGGNRMIDVLDDTKTPPGNRAGSGRGRRLTRRSFSAATRA